MPENTNLKNSEYGHFLRSDIFNFFGHSFQILVLLIFDFVVIRILDSLMQDQSIMKYSFYGSNWIVEELI